MTTDITNYLNQKDLHMTPKALVYTARGWCILEAHESGLQEWSAIQHGVLTVLSAPQLDALTQKRVEGLKTWSKDAPAALITSSGMKRLHPKDKVEQGIPDDIWNALVSKSYFDRVWSK
jgi:hypothetical protein